jgi:hypothetical protein
VFKNFLLLFVVVHICMAWPAEECDEAIEELEDTRRRVRALSRPPPGHVPLSVRVKKLVAAVQGGAVMTIKFVVTLPGRCGAVRG